MEVFRGIPWYFEFKPAGPSCWKSSSANWSADTNLLPTLWQVVSEQKEQAVIKNASWHCQSVSLKIKTDSWWRKKNCSRRKIRDGDYLVMQGRTDESLGFGCCCYKLKHLPVKEERFTCSARDRLQNASAIWYLITHQSCECEASGRSPVFFCQ